MNVYRKWPGTALALTLKGDEAQARGLVPRARVGIGHLFDTMREGQQFRQMTLHGADGSWMKLSVWRTAQGEKAQATIYAGESAQVEIEKIWLAYAVDTLTGEDTGPYVSIGEKHSHTSLSVEVSYGADGPRVLACPPLAFEKWDDDSTDNPRQDTNVKKDATYVAYFYPGGATPPPGITVPPIDQKYNIVRHSGCFGPFQQGEVDYSDKTENAELLYEVSNQQEWNSFSEFVDYLMCNYRVVPWDGDSLQYTSSVSIVPCETWVNLGSFSDENTAYTAARGFPIGLLQPDGKIHVDGCFMGVKYTVNGTESKFTLWELLN